MFYSAAQHGTDIAEFFRAVVIAAFASFNGSPEDQFDHS